MTKEEYFENIADTCLSQLLEVYSNMLQAMGAWEDDSFDKAEKRIEECNEISIEEIEFIIHGEYDNAYRVSCGEEIDY